MTGESKAYELRTDLGAASITHIHTSFERHNLRVTSCRHGKKDGRLLAEITAIGQHDSHNALLNELVVAPWVEEFTG